MEEGEESHLKSQLDSRKKTWTYLKRPGYDVLRTLSNFNFEKYSWKIMGQHLKFYLNLL